MNDFIADIIDAEISYVPVPVHPYANRIERRDARYERDGITDIEETKSQCKLCHYGVEIQGCDETNEGNEIDTFVRMYINGVNTMPTETLFADMAEYWNTSIYAPMQRLGCGSAKLLTASEVEIHFHECDRTNPIPALDRSVRIADDLTDIIIRTSILVEKHVAGSPTGDIQLTQHGMKWLIETCKWRQSVAAELSGVIQEYRCNRQQSRMLLPGSGIKKKRMVYSTARRIASERGPVRANGNSPTSRSEHGDSVETDAH